MNDHATPVHECRIEHVCTYSAGLHPPEVIGPVPEGIRANFYISGGPVSGPRLRGRMRAVGADCFLMRADGVGVLDVRATIETDDGALIEVCYGGLGDAGPDGYQRFLDGTMPARLPLRTAPRFRCAHPRYAWLQRSLFVGVGEVDLQALVVHYDVYRIS
jgi:hypothetical protein